MIDQETRSLAQDAVLRYDHNVVEHLGIRLYQNKLPNVIAELVSNSWDAGAENVDIFLDHSSKMPTVVVADDGAGMNYEHLRDHYLIIGKPKRKSPKELVYKDRKPMGRKGIGKLAPFGVARTVDVITLHNGEMNWFTLELNSIIAASETQGVYKPPFTLTGSKNPAEWLAADGHLTADQTQPYIDRLVKSGSGTSIIMSALTLNNLMLDDEIRRSMADRYNIVLARDDFCVHVNGIKITNEESLPKFDFRIPVEGFSEEVVGDKDVRFWVGFVGSAKWSSEQAGVGVYCHGKIAQDRPFYFNAKGKEIFQRYLYAVVEADWIDELPEDVISTDRTGVDWQNPALSALGTWGARKVLNWLEDYSRHRSTKHYGEVVAFNETLRRDKNIPRFTKAENEEIDKLVADVSKDISRDDVAVKEEILVAVSKAWVNLPSRTLIKTLWKSLSDAKNEDSFLTVISRLHEQSVPEAMGLALTFAQRAYALSVLNELVHRKSETNLQGLIEEFPWILQARGDLLTANAHLKTTIDRAVEAIGDGDKDRIGRQIKLLGQTDRADFVFLTDSNQRKILVVEIKAPNHEINQENRRQLVDYVEFVQQYKSGSQVSGMLVGSVPREFKTYDERITAKSWDDILLECRASYVDLLAAMLDRADLDPSDSRIGLVHEFGGDAVWELLKSFAVHSEPLRLLMDRHSKLLLASP